ncbi:MAG: nucleoside phosphorylase [Cyclobacteriaceae bacterium]|nr:nucleoside phosphorylase [Cyclobacteriaceae bacterium]
MKISSTDLIVNPDGSVYHLGLRPEDLAPTIITVGDPERVEKVSRHLDRVTFRKNRREFVTHTGELNNKQISVISTGIGTDNVEIFFNEVDALVNINLTSRKVLPQKQTLNVIRIGTSGSLQKEIPIGTHLMSERAIGFDNLMNFYDLNMDQQEISVVSDLKGKLKLSFEPYMVSGSADLLQRMSEGMVRGTTVTCPGFYAPQGRKLRLPIRFPNLLRDLTNFRSGSLLLTNFEMETAGLFALGKLLGHEVVSANAIIANREMEQFSSDPEAVIDSLIQKILERI